MILQYTNYIKQLPISSQLIKTKNAIFKETFKLRKFKDEILLGCDCFAVAGARFGYFDNIGFVCNRN